MEVVLREKLIQTKNDPEISNIILSFLDKCKGCNKHFPFLYPYKSVHHTKRIKLCNRCYSIYKCYCCGDVLQTFSYGIELRYCIRCKNHIHICA